MRLLAVALMSLLGLTTARATAIEAQIQARPLTPNDIKIYQLPSSTERSGGLSTVGVGTPVYLEADVNIALALASITNISWSLSGPIGSAAAFTNSPLGTNVPLYSPSDQLVYQVAARTLLRPDLAGQYTVGATIATTTNGTTNVTFTINAGTYLGIYTCTLCHSGSTTVPSIVPSWETTGHSHIFTEGIDGLLGSHYSAMCLQCHTVGYDTNPASFIDGGFYAVAQQDNWTFPTVLASSNFADLPANLQNLGNVQCENCHGPGSLHAGALGDTNAPGWPLVSSPVVTGDCNQCHDSPPTERYGNEWYSSVHAVTTTIPTGRGYCVQCHTAEGFITRIDYTGTNATTFAPTNTIDTTYAAIGCQTCHEPMGQTLPTNNAHLIRTELPVTLGDGTVVTNAGEGTLCLECHRGRDGSASNNVALFASGQLIWPGGSVPPSSRDFGPHDGPQGDLIEGANAITYGLTIPSAPHRYAVSNLCVGCHMQAVASTDPGFMKVGEHTFEMKYSVVTNGVTNIVDQVAVCTPCHGPISSFNFPVADYANLGVVAGVQTEVQALLNQLSTLLPNSKGVVDGSVKTSLSVTTNWTQAQLDAAYDWMLVNNDGSLGVHNVPFAVGILKASIDNLTGVSVVGGLPNAWEIQWFGSLTNAEGAPNADPAGDGIPNWLKYALGLDPLVAGIQVPGGVVYANGNSLGGGSTNTIQIYTAAQISFDTVAGTTYQIQEVSALSDGWQNVGPAILATNTASMSYLTPTVGNLQQYFRVMHNP